MTDEGDPFVKKGRRRRSTPRARTLALKNITQQDLRSGAVLNPPVDIPRPLTRGECRDEPRPCPWIACKQHLYLDVSAETGSIKFNFPNLEPWELVHTCALDQAELGGMTLEEVGERMNVTRERTRQLEVRGLLTLRAGLVARGVDATSLPFFTNGITEAA